MTWADKILEGVRTGIGTIAGMFRSTQNFIQQGALNALSVIGLTSTNKDVTDLANKLNGPLNSYSLSSQQNKINVPSWLTWLIIAGGIWFLFFKKRTRR